jgi:exopolysaccharide biosynthesis polyprenyl glycosylphosphotransferase
MYRFKQATLAIGDLLLLYVGLFAALAIRYGQIPGKELTTLAPPMGVLFILGIVTLFIAGAYDLVFISTSWKFYKKILTAGVAWLIASGLYFYLNPDLKIAPKTILLLTTVIGFSLIALWRSFHTRYISNILKKSNIVFLGLPPAAEELITILQQEPERGFQIVGILNPSNPLPVENSTYPLTTTNELKKILETKKVELVVIAPNLPNEDKLLGILYENLFKQIELVSLAEFYERIMNRIPPFTFSESWFLTNLREQEKKMYDRIRILTDYLLGSILGFIWILTFPFIALAIKTTSSGPIFFKQQRIGRTGRVFTIYKYRTMHALAPDGSAETSGPQFARQNDLRVTNVGKLLRKTRLDEIPQAINILRGEMSFIGPRPERPEFVMELTKAMPFYSLRHLVKPGLTGWAQINKEYYGTIDENLQKLEYDLFYIKNRGFLIDLAITLRTINIVLGMKGR